MRARAWIAILLSLGLGLALVGDAAARGGGGGGGGGRGGGGGGRGGGLPGGRGGGIGGRGGGIGGRGGGIGGAGGIGGFGSGRLRGNQKNAKDWQLLQEQESRKKMIQERREQLMESDRLAGQEAWLAQQRLDAALLRVAAAPSSIRGTP